MEFRIFGPLEVRKGGRPLPLGGAKQRALLAVLLLRANQVVSSDRLIDELWGEEPPETAANTLQVYVSQLRKVLEAGGARGASRRILLTRPPGYLLRVEPDQLDLTWFEGLVEEGRRALAVGAPEIASAKLREAVALWRGQALADFAFEPFAQTEIARLEELRLAAIEDRVEADLALGRHADLVAELEALVAQHPLRERLRGQLMLALYRSGRQAEALQEYRKTRSALVEELGIEPSPALQRLEKAILLQDPALELARPPATEAPPPLGRTAPMPAREARKTVTALFTDLTGSTRLERLDPEALHRVLSRYFATVSQVLERHGGTVERLAGGAVMALFGIPQVHEDDAVRAVRAAAELREAIAALNEELESEWGVHITVRTGVNSGEVLAEGPSVGRSLVTGDALNVAARLHQAAGSGEIVIGDPTQRLVRSAARLEPLGPLFFEGRAEGVPAWRLVEFVPEAPAVARRFDAPMVGREHELAQLLQAFKRAVRERTLYLFTILGPAGIGKSRLAAELRSAVEGEATVLAGRCLSYGDGITFWPLAEVVTQAAGGGTQETIAELLADDDDATVIAERVAGAIGLAESAGGGEETFWAARKLLEAVARRRPLVLVFDDVHWAEPTFLDLVEHLADWTREAPILLVCLARPELLDARPSWGGGKVNATSILLEPLSERDSEALIENLLGEVALAGNVRARIAEAAEGNPLFIEQMLAMLSEDGDSGGEVSVPPTIQALLAARLDRLSPEERAVLEGAAVIGKDFWAGAAAELSPEGIRAKVAGHLQTLARKELIRSDRSRLAGEDAFRFRHLLIRDCAYESIPKRARADLHERFAAWLERAAEDRTREYEEILGYHLEQAYRYRSELEPVDDRGRELAARAAQRLGSAGRRAYVRGDMPATVSLLARAASLSLDEDAGRLELLVDLGEALREIGDFSWADGVLAEAVETAAAAGERALESRARIARLRLQIQLDPEITTDDVLRAAERAIDVCEELGDERGLAKAWAFLAWVPWLRGQAAAAEEAFRRAIEHARRAGDDRAEAQSLNFFIGSSLFGPTPVADAVRGCEEILAGPLEQQRIAASGLRALAALKAMEGAFEEARELIARDRAIVEDLGLAMVAAGASEVYGMVELLAGDPAAAERALRSGYETLEQMGEKEFRSTVAAVLAQALYAQERPDEALRFTQLSEDAAAKDDLSAQVQWRGVRAKVLARRGELEEAEALGREAVALAGQTDFLNMQGDTLLDLAEVLHLAGRSEEAVPLVEQAIGLYVRKGNAVSAGRARALLADFAGALLHS